MGIGDWGFGIGDWGLGIGPNPQSPIPNPQSPIPNPQVYKLNLFLNKIVFILINLIKNLNCQICYLDINILLHLILIKNNQSLF